MRRLLVLALLAPLAAAGTMDAPEIVDPAGDTRGPAAGGDILAAWLENETEAGITTVIQLAALDPTTARMSDHYFVFHLDGRAYCTFAYGEPDGGWMFMACAWDEARRFQSEGVATTGRVEAGAPAHVRVDFPWSYLDDAPARPWTLDGLLAETFDFKRPLPDAEGGNVFLVDHASTDAVFRTAAAAPPPDAAPATPEPARRSVPAPGVLLLVLAGLLTARATSAGCS